MKKIYQLKVNLSKERQIISVPIEIVENLEPLSSFVKDKILVIDYLIIAKKEREKREVPISIIRKEDKVDSSRIAKVLGGTRGEYAFIEKC